MVGCLFENTCVVCKYRYVLYLPRESCKKCVISREGCIFNHEVAFSFRVYLPLALEVYSTLSIISLGFMVVDEIEKKTC